MQEGQEGVGRETSIDLAGSAAASVMRMFLLPLVKMRPLDREDWDWQRDWQRERVDRVGQRGFTLHVCRLRFLVRGERTGGGVDIQEKVQGALCTLLGHSNDELLQLDDYDDDELTLFFSPTHLNVFYWFTVSLFWSLNIQLCHFTHTHTHTKCKLISCCVFFALISCVLH